MLLNINDEFYEFFKTDGEYMYFRSPINGNVMVVRKMGNHYMTLDGIRAGTDDDISIDFSRISDYYQKLYIKCDDGDIPLETFFCAYNYLEFYHRIGFEYCNFSKILIWKKELVNTIIDSFHTVFLYSQIDGIAKYIRKGHCYTNEYMDKLHIQHVGGVYDKKYYSKRDLTPDECEFILLTIDDFEVSKSTHLHISAIKYAIQSNLEIDTFMPMTNLLVEAITKKDILYTADSLHQIYESIFDMMYFVVLSDVDYLIRLVQNMENMEKTFRPLNREFYEFKEYLILKFNDWEKLYTLFPEIFNANSSKDYIFKSEAFRIAEFDFASLYNIAVIKLKLFDKSTFMNIFFQQAFSKALSSNDISTMKILMSFLEEEEEEEEEEGKKEEDQYWRKFIMDLIINQGSHEAANEILIIEDTVSVIRGYRGTRDLDIEKVLVSKMNLTQEFEFANEDAWPISDNEEKITYYAYPPMILNSKFRLETQLQMLNLLTCNILLIDHMLRKLFDEYSKDEEISLIVKWSMQSRYKNKVSFNNMPANITKNLVQAIIDNKVPFGITDEDFRSLSQQIALLNYSYVEDRIEAYSLLKEHYDLDSLYEFHIKKGHMNFEENYQICQMLNLPKTAAILEKLGDVHYPMDINGFLTAALITQSFMLKDCVLPKYYFEPEILLRGQVISLIVLTNNTDLLSNFPNYKEYMAHIPTRNKDFIYEHIRTFPSPDAMPFRFSCGYEYYICIYDLVYGIDKLIKRHTDSIFVNGKAYIECSKIYPQYMRNMLTRERISFLKGRGYSHVDEIVKQAIKMNEYVKHPIGMQFYKN